jgi:hypothetical protein
VSTRKIIPDRGSVILVGEVTKIRFFNNLDQYRTYEVVVLVPVSWAKVACDRVEDMIDLGRFEDPVDDFLPVEIVGVDTRGLEDWKPGDRDF